MAGTEPDPGPGGAVPGAVAAVAQLGDADGDGQRIGYVLAIGCGRRVPTAAGQLRADQLTAGLPQRAWQRLSAGAGAKGQRYYDWALITLTPPAQSPESACSWLLVRRRRDTGECAYYRCYNLDPVPLRELVRVAGRRWTVEEFFQTAKGLVGLDQHPLPASDDRSGTRVTIYGWSTRTQSVRAGDFLDLRRGAVRGAKRSPIVRTERLDVKPSVTKCLVEAIVRAVGVSRNA